MRVEVTERDGGEDGSGAMGVISPAVRSQRDRVPNLHPRYRTRGVSSPSASTYTPSHAGAYTPVPDKSFHLNQIPTRHTTPRTEKGTGGR